MAGALAATLPADDGKGARMSKYEMDLLPKAHRDALDAIDEAVAATNAQPEGQQPTEQPVLSPEFQQPAPLPNEQPAPVPASTDVEARLARFENDLAVMREQQSATERALADERAESARLRSELEQAKATPPAAPLPAELSDITAYGQAYGFTDGDTDLAPHDLAVVRKMIKAEIAEALKAVDQKVDGKLAEQKQTIAFARTAAEKQYIAERDHAIPDFEEINADPAFDRWLNGIDVKTGFQRKVLAQRAASEGNVQGMALWFDEFRAATGRKKPAATEKPNLASQFMPEQRGGNATPAAPAPKQRYTNAQYEAETRRVIQLRAAGNTKAAEALEKELDAAEMEGRVG